MTNNTFWKKMLGNWGPVTCNCFSQEPVSWEMKILGEYLTPCYLLFGISKSSTNLIVWWSQELRGELRKVRMFATLKKQHWRIRIGDADVWCRTASKLTLNTKAVRPALPAVKTAECWVPITPHTNTSAILPWEHIVK